MKNTTTSLHNVFKKSQLAIFGLTFFLCSVIFVLVASFTLETYATRSITVLTKALSERIQPAVVFNDKSTIDKILKNFTSEYPIRSISVTDTNGNTIAQAMQYRTAPYKLQTILDNLYFSDPIRLKIQHNNQSFGELVVYGNSSTHVEFFKKIITFLCLGFLFVLMILFWSVNTMYKYLMNAISPIANTARTISTNKDYSLRFPHSNISELNKITFVFNELLAKIQISNQQLESENQQLSHRANHDELTQLPNRNFFNEKLIYIFNYNLNQNIALLFIDNNNFKEINDKFGHLAGDAVLKEMANRLKANLRSDDFIARIGGDEFAVLLNNVTHHDNLVLICENLLNSCKTPIIHSNQEIYFSFSIGVALGKLFTTPETLIAEADSSMYKAKILPKRWFIAS
jgi:diguanylate cyclase